MNHLRAWIDCLTPWYGSSCTLDCHPRPCLTVLDPRWLNHFTGLDGPFYSLDVQSPSLEFIDPLILNYGWSTSYPGWSKLFSPTYSNFSNKFKFLYITVFKYLYKLCACRCTDRQTDRQTDSIFFKKIVKFCIGLYNSNCYIFQKFTQSLYGSPILLKFEVNRCRVIRLINKKLGILTKCIV